MKTYSQFLKVFFLLLLVNIACNDDDPISNDVLVAIAGDDQTGKVNDEILLDGSASYAKDDKPFVYNWSIMAKPQGSVAALENPTMKQSVFTPDKPGSYKIQLRIVRGNLFTTDDVMLTVTPNDPEGPAIIVLDEDIIGNATLTDVFIDPSQPDYLVTNDIAVRGDLTIMPGVTVAFEENTAFEIVTGSIQAKGLADQRIIFRGVTDEPAFWKGIIIHTNSDLNELEYVTVMQGGSSIFTPANTHANVALLGSETSGAALTIVHSSFSESGGYGLQVQGMSSLNEFENNSFVNNALAAAYIPASQLHRIDVASFSGQNNSLQTIETGGQVLFGSDINWKALPYLVSSDIIIKAGVTIEPGAQFRFKEARTLSITNNGYLSAAGTDASRITFTSESPNVYWNGLYFNSYSQLNNLQFSEIAHAGANRIEDAEHEANIVVGHNGKLKIQQSQIKDGLGYGIVIKSVSSLNTNVMAINTFTNLQKGPMFPAPIHDVPPVTGVWLDQWSFNRNADSIFDNLYDRSTGTWFGGAVNPWAIPGASFGIRIDVDGKFIWTIAEQSPMTGCESYSTEYITGKTVVSPSTISFQQDNWRSKFVNNCDESQNVDTDVTPTEFVMPYSINKMYNVLTGEQYWELKLTNPDQSTFSYYRR